LFAAEGNGHPRTDLEDPEKEQMYSSTLPSTSALDTVGGQPHAPGRFTPRKKKTSTHCIRSPAVWTGAEKSYPNRGKIPGPSIT
jgi:hypothetical protein